MFHPLKIAEVRQECVDAISISFDIPENLKPEFKFKPGQHLTLKAKVNGEELRRSYSICSAPHDQEIRVAIKKINGGSFSTWANQSLKKNDVIDVMTPDGKFGIPPTNGVAKRYVAFAAGSGITPILSMIKATLMQEPDSQFTLVYGNRRQCTTMFQESLEDLKNKFLTRFTLLNVYSAEEQEVLIFNGRLDQAKVSEFIDKLIPVESIDEAFICGPGGMIDEVEQCLLAKGLKPENIHLERFGVPTEKTNAAVLAQGDAPEAKVTVIMDGLKREMEFHKGDPSILDVAIKHGMDLPFSCKGGVCCTCRAKVLCGEVRMDKNFSLEPEDVKAGFVLTCQAHPVSAEVIVSFDDR